MRFTLLVVAAQKIASCWILTNGLDSVLLPHVFRFECFESGVLVFRPILENFANPALRDRDEDKIKGEDYVKQIEKCRPRAARPLVPALRFRANVGRSGFNGFALPA
jgi:hypothetical protein